MYDLKAHQARIAEKLEGQFFMRHIGFQVDNMTRGRVEGSMPLMQFSLQHLGFVHGGVVATVADIVAGFAAYSESPLDKNVVTSSLHIMYFHPGEGVRLRAVGQVIKAGSRLHYCESEVYVQKYDHSELLIARANSTMVMV